MGFNINRTWFKEDFIMLKLKEAEDAGLDKIEIKDKLLFGISSYVGQILHDYVPEGEKGEVILKKVWQIISYDEEKIKSETNSKFSSNSNMITSAVFQMIPNDYLSDMNTVITTRDMEDIIHKKSYGLLKAGKYVIDGRGYYGFVTKIYVKSLPDYDKMRRNDKGNPHGLNVTKDEIYVKYKYEGQYEGRIKNGVFPKETELELDKFVSAWSIIEEDTLEELEKKIKRVETSRSLQSYEEQLALGDKYDDLKDETTAIVSFDSKAQLESMSDKIAVKNNMASVIKRSMERILAIKQEELEMMMAAKKAELASVLAHVGEVMAVFKRQMERIERLIVTLELYLGIRENVIQIAEGEPAPIGEPIHLRQQMLYMDEEFGDPADGGIEHKDIEKFEDWMIKTRAFEKIAPEQKCVVILRPRREMKDRGRDMHPIIKAKLENLDRMVYIFIRNGDNVYRIWSDNIEVTDRLFPKKEELGKMVEELMDATRDKEEAEHDSFDHRDADKKMNEAEKQIFYYKRMIILIQGIIQRTQIFAPLPPEFNLLDISTHEGVVKYVYDDENLLMDGKLRFKDWLLEVNKGVTKGSRIIYGRMYNDANSHKHRFSLDWYHDHSAPPMPDSGEYIVSEKKIPSKKYITKRIREAEYEKDQESDNPKYESLGSVRYSIRKNIDPKDINDYKDEYETDEKGNYIYEFDVYVLDENGKRQEIDYIDRQLRFSYNPKDTVYGSWGDYSSHERKTNITFRIFPEEDSCFIHYDACDPEDIEFYINNRIDRMGYLNMMPILWTLKAKLKEEKQWETGFIKSLSGELAGQFGVVGVNGHEMIAQEIVSAIEWWKNEVVKVWKRPISKDDLKAHRMIKDRVVSKLKKVFKKKDVAIANNKRTMIFKYVPSDGMHSVRGKAFKFIIYGVFKNEFADMIRLWSHSKFWSDWNMKKISMAKIKREIAILESGELVEKSKKHPKELIIIKDGVEETNVGD